MSLECDQRDSIAPLLCLLSLCVALDNLSGNLPRCTRVVAWVLQITTPEPLFEFRMSPKESRSRGTFNTLIPWQRPPEPPWEKQKEKRDSRLRVEKGFQAFTLSPAIPQIPTPEMGAKCSAPRTRPSGAFTKPFKTRRLASTATSSPTNLPSNCGESRGTEEKRAGMAQSPGSLGQPNQRRIYCWPIQICGGIVFWRVAATITL
ncbi:hypothetical protein ACVWZU_002683 [Thermostichus sp. MS-CIW-26]